MTSWAQQHESAHERCALKMRVNHTTFTHVRANLNASTQPGVRMPPSASALFRSLAAAHQTCRKATNVSQAAEAGLSHAVAEKRAELWLTANREALESSNAYVEAHGLPLARHRQF